jgi:excisionase family DNA binding protein
VDLPATLTVNQVAELLQVEPRTIRRNIEFGEIPARKIGRVWRIPKSFVLPYLNPEASHESVPATHQPTAGR